jgi:hypothetical protein
MIKTDDQQSLNEIDQEKSYTLHQSQPIPPRLNAYSGDFGHLNRRKSAACSG